MVDFAYSYDNWWFSFLAIETHEDVYALAHIEPGRSDFLCIRKMLNRFLEGIWYE